jgi:hypothetical protein
MIAMTIANFARFGRATAWALKASSHSIAIFAPTATRHCTGRCGSRHARARRAAQRTAEQRDEIGNASSDRLAFRIGEYPSAGIKLLQTAY